MKTLSFIRRVDNLGRIVIPVELRRALELEDGQEVELTLHAETLVLQKFEPGCLFCGALEELVVYEGKNICASCRQRLIHY